MSDDLMSAAEVADLFGCRAAEVGVLMRDLGVAFLIRSRRRMYRRADVWRVWSAVFGHSPRD